MSILKSIAGKVVTNRKNLEDTMLGKSLLQYAADNNIDVNFQTLEELGHNVYAHRADRLIRAPHNVSPSIFAHEIGHIIGNKPDIVGKIDKTLKSPLVEEARASLNALKVLKNEGGYIDAISSVPRLGMIYSTYAAGLPIKNTAVAGVLGSGIGSGIGMGLGGLGGAGTGGTFGAAIGYSNTKRKEGETYRDFKKRRIKSSIIGAGIGGIGAGLVGAGTGNIVGGLTGGLTGASASLALRKHLNM